MTADRPRAWNSTLPVRRNGLARTPFPVPLAEEGTPRFSSLTRNGGLGNPRLAMVVSDGAAVLAPAQWQRRQRKDTIPKKVRDQVHARDERWCQHCGGHFPDGGIHLHHRRLKQAGGDPRPHTDDACNLVSLCYVCHGWFHDTPEGREKAEAEGFIIPNTTLEPGLHPVLLHGELDSGGQTAWLTCDGSHVFTKPGGDAA